MRTTHRWVLILLVILAFGACQEAERLGDDPPEGLDDDATHVREQLGDLCSSFDFGFKRQINGQTYRPVNCTNNDNEVTLRILVFADDRHMQESWRDVPPEEDAADPGPPGSVMVDVDDAPALVEVYDRTLLDEVRARV